MASFRTYLSLTKPGIIRGNALTAAAGFFLAARGEINVGLFAAMLVGLSLIVASACVFNNYIDSEIDKKMTRTKRRALAEGSIPIPAALLFGTALGVTGGIILGLFTNFLTLAIALLGFFFYVIVYGFYKRRSMHGTLVGSLSGAVPPVVGYCAVSNELDGAALILFLILIFWQMPHFYTIAMYRSKDYAAASIPVLPLVKSVAHTKIQITAYILAFTVAASALSVFGYASYAYAAVAGVLGVSWFFFAVRGFTKTDNDNRWARRMFSFSLMTIAILCVTIMLDSFVAAA